MPIDFNQWGSEPEAPLDFDLIKSIALCSTEMILHRWLPGGKVVRGEYLCGSIRGGSGESCSTNVRDCVGGDFASTERWGDPIDLVATVEGISQGEAARKLEEFLGITAGTPAPPPIEKQTEEEKRAYAQKVSVALWVEGEACPPAHPYLINKQVLADNGIRYHPRTGNILIPLRDGPDILGVQRISADGSKKVNAGGRLSGCYHVIQGELDTVYICEGYATAMTVHMATGKTAVMAVSAGNLQAVGEKIAKMYPAARLVFAADNDQGGEKNPGVEAAEKAVRHLRRGQVIAPPFPDGQKGDWNDYALIHGGAETKQLLLTPIRKRLFIDIKTMVFPEPRFLIEDVLETPCTSVVFGESGGGKSFIVQDWAFHVAAGKKWQGRPTASGPVLYICGEGRHGMPRRMTAWEKQHETEVPLNRFMMSSTIIDFTPESIDEMILDINQMSEEIGRPELIVIDTLARALVGNENATEDMNRFVRELDKIQSEYQCAVVVVHHPGVSDGRRMRGNSALLGALDAEIFIDKHGKKIEWLKVKDGEEPRPMAFSLKRIEWGDGKFDNSCAVEYSEFKVDKKETRYRAAAIEALDEAINRDGLQNRCFKKTMEAVFLEKFDEDEQHNALKALTRKRNKKSGPGELQKMFERNEIEIDGEIITKILTQDQITEGMFKGVKG